MYNSGRNGVTQKVSISGAQAGFRGEELKVLLAQALDKRLRCLNVSFRIGVEDYHIVELDHSLFQAFTP